MCHTFKSNTCASFLLLSTHTWIKRHFGCSRQFQFLMSFYFFFFFKDQARTWGPFLPCLSGGYRVLGAQSQCSLSDHLLAWLTNSASAANTCQPCCLPIHLPSQPLLSHQQMPPSPARPNCISRNASGNASTSLSPLSCLAG